MKLQRYSGNPILVPHPDHPWEDLAVFNPAAWYDEKAGEVLLLYRTGESHFEFSECRDFMTPPELYKYPESKLLVYAVKLHPALKDPGDDAAIATYVVNSCDLKDIQEKCDLYYPRFIKLRLEDLGSE